MTSHLEGLEDLKSVVRADVFKAGALAAHLERDDSGGVTFRYTDTWVLARRAPVATTLPLTAEGSTTPSGSLPSFFAGLLPEGRRLGALRRGVKTSPDDELTLLLAVGGDTVGDVQVLPADHEPVDVVPRLAVESFAEVSFARLLADMDITVDRVALPGVQEKVSAGMSNLPISAGGGDFLLKLNPPEFPHLVENESFCLRAAVRAGIPTPETRVVSDADGATGLAVSRFDRRPGKNGPGLVAVEDGCQVLGLPPAAKYRVTTEQLFAALCSICEAPVPAAAELLAQIAFAYLSGNGDAHAKNFSVMQSPSGRWHPTPAYDVPSSVPYGDTTMALTIGGRRDGNIPGRAFLDLASSLAVPERAARRVLDRVADSADLWLPHLAEVPFGDKRLRDWRRVVLNRQRMLRIR